MIRASLSPLAGLALLACAAEPPPPAPAPRVQLPAPQPLATPDPLGAMPVVGVPTAYVPPAPVVFTAKNGMSVWLLERHSLPYVALNITVPTGSSSDPKNQAGLALATADMLDEGAGSRGAIELSRAIDALGASLNTTANTDQSRVSLSVLKKNLTPAFAIFSDVVARPRFEPDEWKRLREILVNDLTERQSEPDEVAKVVTRRVLYGDGHPYAHSVEGTLESAKAWTLPAAERFYKDAWRPDRAILVAVGDVTQGELAALIDGSLGSWKAPKSPPPSLVAPPAPIGPWPEIVLVDRPDAPQSVIAVARPGLAASDPLIPVAIRANIALGGGFTSRLNQDLREEHGYSYGAGSRFSFTRGVGSFVASASVMTDKTAPALMGLRTDVNLFQTKGLTATEVDKTRSQSRADLVETFEGVDAAAAQLAADAALGLGPDYEKLAAARRDAASKSDLDAVASAQFGLEHAIVVVVGPRAAIEDKLREIGYRGEITAVDTFGNPIHPPSAKPKGK